MGMNQEMLWLKEQLKNQKFRILLAIMTVVGIGLVVEFYLLSYSVLKILRYLVLFVTLLMISWIDQREKRIPNRMLLTLLGARMFLLVLEWIVFPAAGMSVLFSSGLGMLLGGGMFLLVHFISKEGLGMGDVKLLAVVGSYVGGRGIMTVVFFTAMISAIFSIVMLACRKIKLKEEMPFAPFVLMGTIMAMVLGI